MSLEETPAFYIDRNHRIVCPDHKRHLYPTTPLKPITEPTGAENCFWCINE